jgi:hypothetical protein
MGEHCRTAWVEGRKEGREGGGRHNKRKTPKQKALGFRSQHAIGLSPEWRSRRTTPIAKERGGNLRESAEVQDDSANGKKQKSFKCSIKL